MIMICRDIGRMREEVEPEDTEAQAAHKPRTFGKGKTSRPTLFDMGEPL